MDFINSMLPYFPQIHENIAIELFHMSTFNSISQHIEKNVDGLRGYQKAIAMLMSPETPYKHILLKHSMGSGKTRTALVIIIKHILKEKTNILFVTVSKSQSVNIKDILISNIQYLKEYEEYFNIINDFIKYKLHIVELYTINTQIMKYLRMRFDLVIIDEIHMIHLKQCDDDIGLNVYNNMKKLLNLYITYKETNIILMTGTPITSHYTKLFEIMNLILPTHEQFSDTYRFQNTKEEQEIIKRKIIGKISNVQYKSEGIEEINIGGYINKKTLLRQDDVSNDTYYTKLFFNIMCGYQANLYEQNKHEDILLFAYPGGYTFKDYFIETPKSIKYKGALRMNLSNPQFLKEHSILYYNILTLIGGIYNSNNNEAVFYFNNTIRNSGNKLLSFILKENGMKEITSSDIEYIKNELKKGQCKYPFKRFVVISSNFGITSDKNIEDIINIYTHPLNKYGRYIKLIIGSEKITIGYNLINGRQAHIILQNSSAIMDQAIARIIRNINYFDKDESYAKIYKHFISGEEIKNDDHFLQKLSGLEKNDMLNSSLLSIVDKSSIDLYITRKLHDKKIHNFSRICNYFSLQDNFGWRDETYEIIYMPVYYNTHIKNKILLFLRHYFIDNRYITIDMCIVKIGVMLNELLYYIEYFITNNVIFNNVYRLNMFFNILFTGENYFEIFYGTILHKNIDILDVNKHYFENLQSKIESIDDYMKLNIFKRMQIIEMILIKQKRTDDEIKILDIEKKYIYDETIKAHILLPIYLNSNNMNTGIKKLLRIHQGGKWIYLQDKDLTLKISNEIKIEKKVSTYENIPFEYIYKLDGDNCKRVHREKMQAKGWSCKTLKVKEIEMYLRELTTYIKVNNLKLKLGRLPDESNIVYAYRLQENILKLINNIP